MNPLPDERLERMEKRAQYELDTEDNGRCSPLSAADVLALIEEVRRLRGRYEPGEGKPGDDRGTTQA